MHLVIIGNGITGVTAARHVRKRDADARITLISDETPHFFSRTALMYVYMGHMTFEETKPYEDHFWPKNRLELVHDRVERIDPDARRLHLRDGEPLSYDRLLIATGSAPRRGGWPGEALRGVQGLYHRQDLETMEAWTRNVRRGVVVGGGLIGIEMAEMLHSRHVPTTFLVRERRYMEAVLPPEESAMVHREIRRHGVELRLETELRAIRDDGSGRAAGVVTTAGEEIPCGFVGLTIGVEPNVGFLSGSGVETDRGVLVDDRFRTNVPDVYAAGDCAQFRTPETGHRAVEQLWYTGRRHGRAVAEILCGDAGAYDRGLFFNSAKFFTIEYQTYGRVPPWSGTDRDGEAALYWEHPDGRKSIRLHYRAGDGAVLGFNVMGVRFRQEVCERWIRSATPVREVVRALGEAHFDPEFFPRYEAELVDRYNARHPGDPLPEPGRRWWHRYVPRTNGRATAPTTR